MMSATAQRKAPPAIVAAQPAATDFNSERAAISLSDASPDCLTLDAAAANILIDANFEIAEMALELAKRADDNSDPVSRGMAMRICNLNLLAYYLMKEKERHHALDLGRTVYGPRFRLGGEKP